MTAESKLDEIKKQAKYGNDVFESHFENLVRSIERKEEEYFWGPPVKSNIPKIFKEQIFKKTVETTSSKTSPPVRKEKIFCKSSQPRINSIKNSQATGSDTFLGLSDEGDKTFLNNPQIVQSSISDIASKEQNVDNKLSSHHSQKMVADEFENFASYYSKDCSKINNFHENVNPVTAGKCLKYKTNAKADVKSAFDKRSENRKDWESKSSLDKSDAQLEISSKNKDDKHTTYQQQAQDSANEATYETQILEDTKLGRYHYQKMDTRAKLGNYNLNHQDYSDVISEEENSDNYKTKHKEMLNKFNSYTRGVQRYINQATGRKGLKFKVQTKTCMRSEFDSDGELDNDRIEEELFDPAYQVPKIADRLKEISISDNDQPFIFNDKQGAVNSDELHHFNNISEYKISERALNKKNKKLSYCNEFVTELSDKIEFQKDSNKRERIHNKPARPLPTFRNRMNKKDAILNQQPGSKPTHSKNKSSTEDLKNKKFAEKNEKPDINKLHYHLLNSNQGLPPDEKVRLIIKITDNKSEKDFKLVVEEPNAISGLRKRFPKFSAYIPDVDGDCITMQHSVDVMNIIWRLLLYINFLDPSIAVAIEVLAVAKSWGLEVYCKRFKEHFLQNILNSDNASSVFSYAHHYNLREVCNACEAILPDTTVLNISAPRIRHKTCSVSIYTFIIPLEIIIPFEPADTDYSLSFKKQIKNEFTFKVISGCYSIIGFQILLNEEYISKNSQNEEDNNMLEIDYSIRNKSVKDDQVIEGRVEKPLRMIIEIHFKEKLVIRPQEVGEVVIETEVEQNLCSIFTENKRQIKDSVGELELMMESNRKTGNSGKKVFLVRKFLYEVTKVP